MTRFLTLVGGNILDRSDDEFVLPEMLFNWLLKLVDNRTNQFVTSEAVSDTSSLALADAIEAITWTPADEMMLAVFGDYDGSAITALCSFLREGDFTIRTAAG